jgi:Fe-S-cluster containining protein
VREPVRVAIRNIWDRIPDVACTGKCADYCRAIAMSQAELDMVRERIPSFPGILEALRNADDGDQLMCPALMFGRCTIHEVRPTVCRMFGVSEKLPCPYGCEPEGGPLPQKQSEEVMDDMRAAGGELGE